MTMTKEQEQKMMILTTNVIMTFEDNTQKFFDHRTNIVNDKRLSEYGLEKMLINQIVHHSDNLKKIVKLSICVYSENNSNEVMNNNKISSIFKRTNGKYLFEPDLRCKLVSQLCKEYPSIAKETISNKEWRNLNKLDPFSMMIRKCKNILFYFSKTKEVVQIPQIEEHIVSIFPKKENESQIA